jgi:putative oxidoreductase
VNRYDQHRNPFRRFLLRMARTRRPDAGLLFLRIGLGLGMAWHGYNTLLGGDPPGSGMNSFIEAIENVLAWPFPEFFAYLAKGGELLGGLLLVLGLLTRPALLLLSGILGVAAFVFLSGAPLGERELALLYLVGCLFLLWVGPGRYSVDALLLHPRRKRRRR